MGTDANMAAVAAPSNQFGRKLTRLVRKWPGSQRELADAVGVTQQMLAKYMAGSMPKLDTARRLADVLGADVRWLCNEDDRTLDPPAITDARALEDFTDYELMEEVGRRYHKEVLELRTLLERMQSMDWAVVADAAIRRVTGGETTEAEDRMLRAVERYQSLSPHIRRFDPSDMAEEIEAGRSISGHQDVQLTQLYRDMDTLDDERHFLPNKVGALLNNYRHVLKWRGKVKSLGEDYDDLVAPLIRELKVYLTGSKGDT